MNGSELDKLVRARRARVIARDYWAGFTLQQIGDDRGFSRQRAQQLLSTISVCAASGGVSKQAKDKRRHARVCRDALYFKKFGCDRQEWERIRGIGPYSECPQNAYRAQRANAYWRGIEWQFTLKSWWDVWEASGKWNQRGRQYGQYVMARPNDEGPYSPGNVRICLTTENVIEYCERAWSGNYDETLNRARQFEAHNE